MLVVGLDPNNSSDWTGAERTDPPQAAVSAPGLTLNDIWDSIVSSVAAALASVGSGTRSQGAAFAQVIPEPSGSTGRGDRI